MDKYELFNELPLCARTRPYNLCEDMPEHLQNRWASARNERMLNDYRRSAGSFDRDLIDLFIKRADSNNRGKLVKAFPFLWMDKRECTQEAREYFEGKASAACETCEDRGYVYTGSGFADPDTTAIDCPDCGYEPDPDKRDR